MTKRFHSPVQFRSCKPAFYALVLSLFMSLPAFSQTQFQAQLDKLREAARDKSAVNLFEMLRQNGGQQWSPEKWSTLFGNFDRNTAPKAVPKASGFDQAALLAKLKGQATSLKKNPAQIQALEPPLELEWAAILNGDFRINSSIAVDGSGNSYTVGTSNVGNHILKYDTNGVLQWFNEIPATVGLFEFVLAPPQVAADTDGNFYVCGLLTSDAEFESQNGSNFSLAVPGEPRMFLAKYDTDGNVLWVVSSSDDSGFNAATEIDVDASGNIYISGFFETAVTLGPGDAAETTLTDDGEIGTDAFWAKYNAAGELQWAKAAHGPDNGFLVGPGIDAASDISVDANGNVYIVGYFEDELTFEAGTPGEITFTTGAAATFIAKYDANGGFIWAIAPNLPYFPFAGFGLPFFWGPDIEAAANGNLYVSLIYNDAGTEFSVVIAIDELVNSVWFIVNQASNTSFVPIFDLDSDANSNVYAHGLLWGDAVFDVNGEAVALSTPGNPNIFLQKIDAAGALKWVKTENVDNGSLSGGGVAVGQSGSVFVGATQFAGIVVYGEGEPNQTTIDGIGPVTIKYGAGAGNPYVFLATESIKLDKYKFVEGDMHSNGSIQYENGRPGTHTGSSFAVGKITVNRDNTITGPGDLTAGGTIKVDKKATVHGTISPNTSVDAIALPSLSYTCTGANGSIKVAKDKQRNVAPGAYHTLSADKNAQLNLSAGEYSVTALVLNDRSRLNVDVSAGDVTINVCGEVNFIKNADIIVVGGTSEDLTINYLGTKKVVLGNDGGYQGNLIAPNATVELGSNAGFLGAISAKSIVITKDARVRFHGGAIPKSELNDDDEEMISDQQPVISYELSQNYPNPFNPTTTISFSLPEASEVTLSIYNLHGQLVKQLVAGEMSAGRHNFRWDATDERGSRVASGVYLYVIKAGEFTAQRKLVLLK